jgi:uncharacterized protein
MGSGQSRILLSIIVFLGWLIINVGMSRLLSTPDSSVAGFLMHGVNAMLATSVLFLLAAVWFFGWNDIGLNAPVSARSLWILWLPGIFILLMAAGIVVIGPPPIRAVGFILVNALLIGISEEVMFRGIVFQALRSRLSIWPSIGITSLLFGAMHLMNMTWLGSISLAMLQAGAAFSTGMLLMAIRVRTKSLDPGIILHAVWDFCAIMLTASPAVATMEGPVADTTTLSMAGAYALVTLIYAVFLLRHASRPEPA